MFATWTRDLRSILGQVRAWVRPMSTAPFASLSRAVLATSNFAPVSNNGHNPITTSFSSPIPTQPKLRFLIQLHPQNPISNDKTNIKMKRGNHDIHPEDPSPIRTSIPEALHRGRSPVTLPDSRSNRSFSSLFSQLYIY